MLTCKQFEALISDYMDGLVSRETQAHIDAHLLENEHSRTLLQNVVTTRETLQCLPSICASADFDLRLRSRMAEVARTSGNRPFAWPSFFVGNSRMVMGFAAAACLTIGAFTFNQFGETTEYFFHLIDNQIRNIKEELQEQGFDVELSEVLQSRRANLWGLRSDFESLDEVFESKSFETLEIEDEGSESVSTEGDDKPFWYLSRWRQNLSST